MTIAEAPRRVQKLHTISTKPTQEPKTAYDRPIAFLTDGTIESLAALPGVHRLAAGLGCQLSVVDLLGGDDRRLAAMLAALPGEPPAVSVLPEHDLDAALARHGGIVALLPKRRGALLRFLIGSRHEHLLRHGSLPVLALPSTGQLPQIARVLFPADLSPRSQAPFDEAIALCKALNAELHVLHVYGEDRLLPSEQDLARRAAATNPYQLMLIDKEQLRALADHAAAQGVQTHVRTAEGRAHAQILAYAAANAIDLVVMASHGPRTSEDILLGSTTVRVIESAPVAVLAMLG
jgi:nucleotide-binding universal stress UspA family protein